MHVCNIAKFLGFVWLEGSYARFGVTFDYFHFDRGSGRLVGCINPCKPLACPLYRSGVEPKFFLFEEAIKSKINIQKIAYTPGKIVATI